MASATPGQAVLDYIKRQTEPRHGEQASMKYSSMAHASVPALTSFNEELVIRKCKPSNTPHPRLLLDSVLSQHRKETHTVITETRKKLIAKRWGI